MVPEGGTAAVDYDAWDRPPIFSLIQEHGNVPEEDMRQTFNLGIGMVAVVRAEEASRAVDQLEAAGESPIRMGRIETAGASH